MSVIIPFALLVLILFVGFVNPIYSLIIGFGAIILVLAFRKPDHWLAIAFAAGVFPQSIAGTSSNVYVAFSDAMAVLMLAVYLPALAMRKVRPSIGPLAGPVFLFIGAVLIASVGSWHDNAAITLIARMVEFALVLPLLFVAFVKTPAQMDRCFVLLMACGCFLGLAGMAGFASGSTHGLYILGMHKNSLGPSLACGVVTALVYLRAPDVNPKYKRLLFMVFSICLIGTVLSLSRGGWISAAGACLLVLWLRRDFKGLVTIAAIAVPIFIACWSFLPPESADYAGDISLNAHTMKFRLHHQADAIEIWKGSPMLGEGVGAFKVTGPENVYIQTLAETGIIGLASFLILIGSVYALIFRLRRQLTVSNQLGTAVERILYCCAGVFTVPLIQGFVDTYWRRGVVFLGWASAGICLSIWIYLRQTSKANVPVPRRERYRSTRVANSTTLP